MPAISSWAISISYSCPRQACQETCWGTPNASYAARHAAASPVQRNCTVFRKTRLEWAAIPGTAPPLALPGLGPRLSELAFRIVPDNLGENGPAYDGRNLPQACFSRRIRGPICEKPLVSSARHAPAGPTQGRAPPPLRASGRLRDALGAYRESAPVYHEHVPWRLWRGGVDAR